MPYNANIPQPTDLLSNSQGDIRNNFSQANTSFGIDHLPFTDASANLGYHKDIHQVPQADPAPIAGINQLYSKLYTPNYAGAVADTQLFNMTGLGGISQLTGNNAILNGGWTWVGGILLMWGQQALTAASTQAGVVTFSTVSATSIPFPNSCFNVQITYKSNAVNNSSTNICVTGNPTNLAFSWAFSGTGANVITSFNWFAIGR